MVIVNERKRNIYEVPCLFLVPLLCTIASLLYLVVVYTVLPLLVHLCPFGLPLGPLIQVLIWTVVCSGWQCIASQICRSLGSIVIVTAGERVYSLWS